MVDPERPAQALFSRLSTLSSRVGGTCLGLGKHKTHLRSVSFLPLGSIPRASRVATCPGGVNTTCRRAETRCFDDSPLISSTDAEALGFLTICGEAMNSDTRDVGVLSVDSSCGEAMEE